MKSEWRLLGPTGHWTHVRDAVAFANEIVLATEDGSVHVVDVRSGAARSLTHDKWQPRLLATARGRVYVFDESGRLYAMQLNGQAEQLDGDWSEVRAAVGADRLYVVRGQQLGAIDCEDSSWHALGTDEWRTALLLADANQLYALEENGSLYRVDRADGWWQQLDGDWGDVTAGVGTIDQIYLISESGLLYAVSPSGDLTFVPAPRIEATHRLLATETSLVALGCDGSLRVIDR